MINRSKKIKNELKLVEKINKMVEDYRKRKKENDKIIN